MMRMASSPSQTGRSHQVSVPLMEIAGHHHRQADVTGCVITLSIGWISPLFSSLHFLCWIHFHLLLPLQKPFERSPSVKPLLKGSPSSYNVSRAKAKEKEEGLLRACQRRQRCTAGTARGLTCRAKVEMDASSWSQGFWKSLEGELSEKLVWVCHFCWTKNGQHGTSLSVFSRVRKLHGVCLQCFLGRSGCGNRSEARLRLSLSRGKRQGAHMTPSTKTRHKRFWELKPQVSQHMGEGTGQGTWVNPHPIPALKENVQSRRRGRLPIPGRRQWARSQEPLGESKPPLTQRQGYTARLRQALTQKEPVMAWIQNVPQGFKCLNTWSPAGSIVLEGCRV